ncbi:ADP-ribosylglycohydrolase family protein [Microbulbifer sp. OS29]|uniref:ADP-ribosylglycohydrolase family protein n=1 Tax=Microbulbifer okhotskensis TaxID=2926617 RepID=A0A9X2ERA5_9GAMM|nr:ADP-ribosylglycohydrolase family protein [Microbulbifer okhotskensis]MCO1336994.1 ADP-ribosylglycohydrolase family protein [Microbulbifer okhotskensis]
MIKISKYRGCFKGLAVGDSFGAPYEGGLLERQLWKFIGKTKQGKRRYTDDTQMSIDIAASFLEYESYNQEHLAKRFAQSYQWTRGYGASAAKLLKGVRSGKRWQDLNRIKFKQGSVDNGAAMRAPIIALSHPRNDTTLKKAVQLVSEITHAHPTAIEGAYIIAVVICEALRDRSNKEIFNVLESCCQSDIYRTKLAKCKTLLFFHQVPHIQCIKKDLGNGVTAVESCVTAIYFGLQYRNSSLTSLLANIFTLGGDTDTIAAMAASIWGSLNGEGGMTNLAQQVENIEYIDELSEKLYYSHYQYDHMLQPA